MLRMLIAASIAGGLLGLLSGQTSAADEEDDAGRIAIIDASINTKDYLAVLKTAGVKVIGRYYARCWQDITPEKRIANNPGEIDAILGQGFGVLSVYQFYSGSPLKFFAKRKIACPTDKKKTLDISLPDANCVEPKIDNCKQVSGEQHDVATEAALDANAAVEQAKAVNQPPKTAIYFGVDFDLGPATKDHVLKYFSVVSTILRDHDYLVGAYGNGAALDLLRDNTLKDGKYAGSKLVDFTWLNASRGHEGAAKRYNSNDWDLFQTRTDVKFPSGAAGDPEVDLDVQNRDRASKSIGFWNKDGPYQVPEARTIAVYDQRRFACSGLALIRNSPDLSGNGPAGFACGRRRKDGVKLIDCDADVQYPPDDRPRICFGDVTRVGKTQGSFTQVDCDEDGTFEGWTRSDNLSSTFATRPKWIDKRTIRRATERKDTICK